MLKTKTETFTIKDGDEAVAEFRYRPLPVLDVADYLESYGEQLEASSALSTLSTYGAGLVLPQKGEALDLGTAGVLGRVFVQLLTATDEYDSLDEREARKLRSRRLRQIIVDHCVLFEVETSDGTKLDSADAINEHVHNIGIALGIVAHLAGGSLRPLSILFQSRAGDEPAESPKPSPTPSPES